MRILVITGSPRKKGTSAVLAEQFIAGAESAGHTVVRFDAALKKVAPCVACYYCKNHPQECARKDDMAGLIPDLIAAEMVVFVTPLYYSGMSAQLKAVIDRFYAINSILRETPKQALLLASGADEERWPMETMETHFQAIFRYLKWQYQGSLLALGVHEREDIERTDYPGKARVLGEKAGVK